MVMEHTVAQHFLQYLPVNLGVLLKNTRRGCVFTFQFSFLCRRKIAWFSINPFADLLFEQIHDFPCFTILLGDSHCCSDWYSCSLNNIMFHSLHSFLALLLDRDRCVCSNEGCGISIFHGMLDCSHVTYCLRRLLHRLFIPNFLPNPSQLVLNQKSPGRRLISNSLDYETSDNGFLPILPNLTFNVVRLDFFHELPPVNVAWELVDETTTANYDII
mmetsp:Transcript_23565/g.42188  ORF Transcript_23565/g.42188 Transcript_23565/m.42188 type:complete len:216 (+) Transcript_23565:677-1324(+)